MKRKVSFLIYSAVFFLLVFLSIYGMAITGGFIFYTLMGVAIMSVVLVGVFIGYYLRSNKKTLYVWQNTKDYKTVEVLQKFFLSENDLVKVYRGDEFFKSDKLAMVYIEDWGVAFMSFPEDLPVNKNDIFLKRKNDFIKIN